MRESAIEDDEMIRCVAEIFQTELAKLHARSDWPSYQSAQLYLRVSYSPEKSTFKLVSQPPFSDSCEGSRLGALMDEVYHRLDFDDTEKARIETSLKALPKLQDFDDGV